MKPSTHRSMKTKLNLTWTLTRLACGAMGILLISMPITHAQEKPTPPKNTNAELEQESTFTIPSSLQEGRDPFFPRSTRFISKPVLTAPALGPVVLECKGISGTSKRPLAIINNRTFAVGDEQDVNTAQGKVRVLCLEIDGMKVKVRAQGRISDLLYRKGI